MSYDGHASKKLRTNIDGHGVQSGSRDRFDDREKRKTEEDYKQDPSPVVHVRSLHPSVVEADVWDVLERFGKIVNVFMMNRKHQALVEFDSIDSAVSLVRRSQTDTIFINNNPALFNFSKSKEINMKSAGGGDRDDDQVSRRRGVHNVVLFTILKPLYPVTVEVMHTICKSFGEIARIVIFHKSTLQSMVEFTSSDDAVRAKKELQGADIYSGCCTLKTEFAKATKLNVYRNDSESWDFTNPNVGRAETADRNRPLLAAPDGMGPPRPFDRDGMLPVSPGRGSGGGGGGGGYGGGRGGFDGGYDNYGSGTGRMQMDMDDRGRDRWMDRDMGGRGMRGMYDEGRGRGFDAMVVAEAMGRLGRGYGMDLEMDMPMGRGDMGRNDRGNRERGYNGPQMALLGGSQGLAGGNATPQQNCVLMFYGMNGDMMNCERLFNLVCLYGNVVRIKFLKSKDGAAMVQMGDAAACERVIQNLNNMTAFDKRFQITYSKQAYLQDQNNPGDLKDGTCAFIDYMGNKNNRFTSPEMAAKNRIQPPGEILHYFNAPPNWEEEDIINLLVDNDAVRPDKVKVFPAKSNARSSSGLLQWSEKQLATDAICLVNHICVRLDGKIVKPSESMRSSSGKNSPFIIKFCFSAAPIV